MGVFLFISFTVIALLLAEFVLRLVDPQPLTRQRENKYLISENILNWSGRNHTREFNVLIEYNRLGMRGEPIEYEKPEKETRLMVLGDSFVEGAQVNWRDPFSARAQHQLSAGGAQGIKILSYGVAGWDTVQELIYLKSEGIKFSPKHVYLFFYPGNDINGSDGRYYDERLSTFVPKTDLNLLYRLNEPQTPLLKIKEYLLSQSHLFTLLKVSLEISGIKNELKGVQRRMNMINIPQRDDSYAATLPREQRIARSWQLYSDLMRQFQIFCKERSIEFHVFVVPHLTQLYPDRHPEEYQKIIDKYWGRPDGYEHSIQVLRDLGVDVIDLYPQMNERKNDQLYYVEDFHWTAAGHALVGDILTDKIKADLNL